MLKYISILFVSLFILAGCATPPDCTGEGCFYSDQSGTEKSYSVRPPEGTVSKFSFEAAVKLCWRQPNYPMCQFDCIENPIRKEWNNWCDAEPAPADQIIDPSKYTEEELLQLLEEPR